MLKWCYVDVTTKKRSNLLLKWIIFNILLMEKQLDSTLNKNKSLEIMKRKEALPI